MNKEKNINKVVKNLENKLTEKLTVYMEMSYIKAIQAVAESIIPYKKNEFENLPYVGE